MDRLPCEYCGIAADTVDHVVPSSLLRAVRDSGDDALVAALADRNRRMTVPACRECNGLAGFKYDQTLVDRRRRILIAFKKRHRRELAMPNWEPRELVDMAPGLVQLVMSGLVERDELRERVRRLSR